MVAPQDRPVGPPFQLDTPLLGAELGHDLAYRRRASAERQAALWNEILAGDPFVGPATGMIVGVAPAVANW